MIGSDREEAFGGFKSEPGGLGRALRFLFGGSGPGRLVLLQREEEAPVNPGPSSLAGDEYSRQGGTTSYLVKRPFEASDRPRDLAKYDNHCG